MDMLSVEKEGLPTVDGFYLTATSVCEGENSGELEVQLIFVYFDSSNQKWLSLKDRKPIKEEIRFYSYYGTEKDVDRIIKNFEEEQGVK